MRPSNELVASNVLSSGTSYSNVMLSECWIRSSFQMDCGSGTMAGTFTVQASNDIATGTPPNQFSPANWFTVGTNSVACSMTVAGQVMIPYFETCYQYHRVQFVPATGAQGWYNIRVKTISF